MNKILNKKLFILTILVLSCATVKQDKTKYVYFDETYKEELSGDSLIIKTRTIYIKDSVYQLYIDSASVEEN